MPRRDKYGVVVTWGDSLFDEDIPQEPIIENILYREDVCMLLGKEKSNKSILAQQMCFNISSGTPLFGKFAVPKARPVVYIQAEGKRGGMVRRFNRMKETIPLDSEKFLRLYKKSYKMDRAESVELIREMCQEAKIVPSVIVLDSLYKMISGDLIKGDDSTKFQTYIDELQSIYPGCAILMLHHESKDWRDAGGQVIDRGDTASYGSVFWRGWVDSILHLKKKGDFIRRFTCETEREGEVKVDEELILVQPDPLYLEIHEDTESMEAKIQMMLELTPGGMTRHSIKDKLPSSDSALERSLRNLLVKKIIYKTEWDGVNPVVFRRVGDGV